MKTTADLIDAVLRLGVHAMGTHVTPVDTDALADALSIAAELSETDPDTVGEEKP